jgi:hypothetical protein
MIGMYGLSEMVGADFQLRIQGFGKAKAGQLVPPIKDIKQILVPLSALLSLVS